MEDFLNEPRKTFLEELHESGTVERSVEIDKASRGSLNEICNGREFGVHLIRSQDRKPNANIGWALVTLNVLR